VPAPGTNQEKSTVRPQPTPFLQRDDVASFTATLLMMQAMAVGTCVKFRRYDGREQRVHLNQPQTDRLIEGLESYYRHGCHTNFTYYLHYHPEEAQALPPSHPYHTIVNMQPKFRDGEAGRITRQTDVLHSSLSDKGEFLVYDVDLANGERAEFRLHECVAHNMLSFMMNMMFNGARLTGEVQGRA
jgi:predicted hotdog family 3-hydroxylacyl-ACP dehydratase